MNNNNEEKALAALLSKTLLSDLDSELSRKEIDQLLSVAQETSEEERSFFESFDPLSLTEREEAVDNLIQFKQPMDMSETELPLASGFYRGGEALEIDNDTLDSVKKKREEIMKRLSEEADND